MTVVWAKSVESSSVQLPGLIRFDAVSFTTNEMLASRA